MNMSPGLRTMTGFVTIGLYAFIGTAAWPRIQWLTAVCVILAAIRIVLLIKQWPRRD